MDQIKICINQLNTTKPTAYNNTHTKIIIEFSNARSNPTHRLYNESILQGSVPDAMKLADVTPSHKKYDKCLK